MKILTPGKTFGQGPFLQLHGTIFHIDYHYKYCKRYLPVGLVIRPSPIVLAIAIAVVGDLMFAKRVTNKRVCPRQFALPNSCRYKYLYMFWFVESFRTIWPRCSFVLLNNISKALQQVRYVVFSTSRNVYCNIAIQTGTPSKKTSNYNNNENWSYFVSDITIFVGKLLKIIPFPPRIWASKGVHFSFYRGVPGCLDALLAKSLNMTTSTFQKCIAKQFAF